MTYDVIAGALADEDVDTCARCGCVLTDLEFGYCADCEPTPEDCE